MGLAAPAVHRECGDAAPGAQPARRILGAAPAASGGVRRATPSVAHEGKTRWRLTRCHGSVGVVRLIRHQEGYVSLDDTVIERDHRRYGVGTALLAEVVTVAERMGARGIG